MFGSRRRKNQETLDGYKKAKKGTFDFERIALLFRQLDPSDYYQVIVEGTLRNLDFEELFMFIDRTCSRIGQQYLYLVLRTIPKDKSHSQTFEKIISYLSNHPEAKNSSVRQLTRLNNSGAYFLQKLIFGSDITEPKWFRVIPILSGISALSLALSFFLPHFILVLLFILPINAFIHFWNKKNILTYSNSIPYLLILSQIADSFIRSGVFMDDASKVQSSNYAIRKLSKNALFFKWEIKLKDELGQFIDFVLELIKIFFLLEPILFFRLIQKVRLIKPEINEVFTAVARVDVAISIDSFRDSLPYYCFPNIVTNTKLFKTEEVYHPLILKPVPNSINLSNGKSALISGSNMSGKTTFIRTVGINIILAQTINTCCAKEFITPRLKIHSAIRITDDLFDETSYYYEEVKTVKQMVDECKLDHQSIFLLDELFRGTNTVERISAGKAVLRYLTRKENLVLASTHDLELTEFLSDSYSYFHFSEMAGTDSLTFDYKLKKGKATNTNAIRILELNNYPVEIVEEAKKLATEMQDRYLEN